MATDIGPLRDRQYHTREDPPGVDFAWLERVTNAFDALLTHLAAVSR